MPVTTTIDIEKRMAIHTVEGELLSGDFVNAISDRLKHADFEPGLHVLWDFSNAPPGILASRDLRGMLEYGRQEGHATRIGRVALLTPRQAQFAIADSVEKMSGDLPVEIRAFQDREEALQWLTSEIGTSASGQARESEEAE